MCAVSSLGSQKPRLMWAKGQILSKRLEGKEEGNGAQRRLQGMRKEEKLESGWTAGHRSPSHRQCEMGNHSPQPPLESLNAPAEGRRGELKTLAKMVFTCRVQVVPCLLSSPLGFSFAPLLSPPSHGWEALAPAG